MPTAGTYYSFLNAYRTFSQVACVFFGVFFLCRVCLITHLLVCGLCLVPFPRFLTGKTNEYNENAAADLGLLAVAPRSIEGHVEFEGLSSSTGQR